jgi:PPOX class probable F420-dependent enzyme
MGIALPDDVKNLIDGRNFAHLASLMADGSPHSAPVWVGREGDLIIVSTGDDSVKGRNTRRDPRVALSITEVRDPYSQAQLRGRVAERRPDPELKIIDAICRKYIGKPWPYREDVPIALVIEIDKAFYSKQAFEHETVLERDPAS